MFVTIISMPSALDNKHIYIFRHGETAATRDNRRYGLRILHARIIDEGKPAIKRMAEYLKSISSDQQFSSQFTRCKETVAIIEEITKKPFLFDKRLNELLIETFGSFKKRIYLFLEDVDKIDAQTVMICTHASVIAGLTSFLTKDEFNRADVFFYPPPGVLVHCFHGKMEMIDFN